MKKLSVAVAVSDAALKAAAPLTRQQLEALVSAAVGANTQRGDMVQVVASKFEPADLDDLKTFLERLGGEIPVMALGLGSNMIVRDGGVPGVVVRLGKAFAGVAITGENEITCGGGASGCMRAGCG